MHDISANNIGHHQAESEGRKDGQKEEGDIRLQAVHMISDAVIND